MEKNLTLSVSKDITVRFSEVDAMHIVWHGTYALYAEDARELFGATYGLGYMDIFHAGFYAPLVDLHFAYKSPIHYGDQVRVTIQYKPSPAAKIQFEYTIWNITRNRIAATGETTQVFLDMDYQLVLYCPEFFQTWKQQHGLA